MAAMGAAVVVATAVAMMSAMGAPSASPSDNGVRAAVPRPAPPTVTALPVPAQSAPPTCDDPAVAAAIAGGVDAEIIAAFGGAASFRTAVASGVAAACVSLSDARRVWVVVNKQRPLDPRDYEPDVVAAISGLRQIAGGPLRDDAAAALAELATTAFAEGSGDMAVNSSYRPFWSQENIYAGHVANLGQEGADRVSARPGYSEHQTGLAVDVAACNGGCGAIDAFGGTPQAAWIAANAWRFGFIVRYEEGYTAITGYTAEPWHLRYIGRELAAAYTQGGYRTLEDFFGLPPAPDYLD